jgi:biotin carboxyl carrier protein
MLDVSKILDEIKAAPYRDISIRAPHTGRATFRPLEPGASVLGPQGTWKEKPGTHIATIERERNSKPICAPETGELRLLHKELEGTFVEAGAELAVLRHKLTRDEVERTILQKALFLFRAPERAKYYFTPEADKKLRASASHTVSVRDGTELFIMSRMKREVPLHYKGPDGVIYEVYFKYNENMDAGAPLVGVCRPDDAPLIQQMVMRVQTEWQDNMDASEA